MIKGTVALPIWNNKRIAWLSLESLCRQNKPIDPWELICMEEDHPQKVGEQYIRQYEGRLKDVGCSKITYITSSKWVPLSRKWIIMANMADPLSRYFCLHGADDYSHSDRLCETESIIDKADWIVTTKGYFYDFHYDRVIEYDINTLTGMQMAVNTNLARNMPLVNKNCGVDGWFIRSLIKLTRENKNKLRCYISCSDNWQHILCTNGLNNISKKRHQYFKDISPPFYPTFARLSDIVPEDIAIRLKAISRSFQVDDDLGCQR